MTEKTTATATTAPAAAADKKAERPKTVAGFAMSAKITMGKDSEGKPFSAENNPKRKGSKSFDKFAKYKDGMTVEQAAAAGLNGADLSWDTKHGFIKIA